jgi:hypothetical protein
MVFVMRCAGAQCCDASDRHPGLVPGPILQSHERFKNGSRLKAGMTGEFVSHNE